MDEILRSLAGIDEMLTVVVVRVQSDCAFQKSRRVLVGRQRLRGPGSYAFSLFPLATRTSRVPRLPVRGQRVVQFSDVGEPQLQNNADALQSTEQS